MLTILQAPPVVAEPAVAAEPAGRAEHRRQHRAGAPQPRTHGIPFCATDAMVREGSCSAV